MEARSGMIGQSAGAAPPFGWQQVVCYVSRIAMSPFGWQQVVCYVSRYVTLWLAAGSLLCLPLHASEIFSSISIEECGV